MNSEIVQFLQQHPLLQGVPVHELEDAAAKMEIVQYAAGSSIIKEGAYGDDALFVMHGFVQVYTRNLIGRPVLLAELGAGNIVGEIGLLFKERRTASIRAHTDVTVLRLERNVFNELIDASPLFHESLKISAEIRYVHALLRKASIWSAIPDSELRGLAEITVRRAVKRGDVIIVEGEKTEQLYLVTSGRFEVVTNGKRKAVLGEGDFFGEIALLAGIDHTRTVVALEDGELLLMGSQEFTYVLQQYPPVLMQFAEVFRIRRTDLSLAEPFASMNKTQEHVITTTAKKTSKVKVDHDIFAGKWLEVMFGLGGFFVLFTILSALTEQSTWDYAALLTGAFVGPVTFVVYMRSSQLLGFRPGRLIFVFAASAIFAIPISWILENWLFTTFKSTTFTDIRIPFSVALIEETAKLVICGLMLWMRRYRFLMDAVVFGAAAGMGFAAVETVLYGVGQIANDSTGGMLVVMWTRALLSPFGHGTWTAIAAAGIWFGLIGMTKYRWIALCLPVTSIALHTLWNYDASHGIVNMILMLMIGIAGLFVLYILIRKGRLEEQRALVRINPMLDEGRSEATLDCLEDAPNDQVASYLYCEACDTQSPPHSRYCARCGQSLRLKRVK